MKRFFDAQLLRPHMWRRDVLVRKTLRKSHMGVSENSGTPKSSI